MSEEVTPATTPEPEDVETAEASTLAVDMGGNKMVPLSALIAAKKEGKGFRDKVKELEPIAARVSDIDAKLENAKPYIDAMVNNPKLRAEAIRAASGTRTTAETTEQPEDDVEAAAFAENVFNFYLNDGVTPDVARARRAMDLMDRRNNRQTDARLQPLASVTLGDKADQNVRYVMAQTNEHTGAPLASRESIMEAANMISNGGRNKELLANPQVADMLITQAIGIDVRKNRTPKLAEEPVYLETAGGGRGQRADVIDSDLRASFARLGIDEKQGSEAVKRLEQGAGNRRGISLGVK